MLESMERPEKMQESQAQEPRPPAMGKTGMRAMQGESAPASSPEAGDKQLSSDVKKDGTDSQAPYANKTFTDNQNRPITVRGWQSGDSIMVRAYDHKVKPPPEKADTGQAGYANLTLERSNDLDRTVSGARLNDIQTQPQYRGSGIGTEMLDMGEQIARENGAKSIHGSLSYASKDEAAVRAFYTSKGYSFRPAAAGGEQVFKDLSQ